MRAARLHEPGKPLQIDTVDVPRIRPHEVLVRVEACGVIPNMNNIFGGKTWHPLPPLPAIVGLDAAGVITQVGESVTEFAEGDRVYINPLLSCGSCSYCRGGEPTDCSYAAFRGYFAFTVAAVKLLRENPYGGFAEYTAAPARNLVRLPREVTFEQGARFGYLGTSYATLQLAGTRAGTWVLINGATGTLGVGAVLWALAMGATRILGLGRNRDVLTRLQALAPRRVFTLALGDQAIGDWVRSHTDGLGVDAFMDCTGRGSAVSTSMDALGSLKRSGVAVNVSALSEPLSIHPARFMDPRLTYRGSNWFSVAQGQQMAELARSGVVDLGLLEPRVFPLEGINDALAEVRNRPGGFVNIVVAPGK
ncbi:MAG: hypothetical protein A3G80_02010 [Betaproteobacteria bacterium RIFCSPLOWO2_12_FULL_62_13b]|nr:MAG: hypothetical protein A3G80_02010 [Betaproteobacteria bacterium RIFCSPLOWO2_12_FULL_62_13b]